jgi:hypothetical protein
MTHALGRGRDGRTLHAGARHAVADREMIVALLDRIGVLP